MFAAPQSRWGEKGQGASPIASDGRTEWHWRQARGGRGKGRRGKYDSSIHRAICADVWNFNGEKIFWMDLFSTYVHVLSVLGVEVGGAPTEPSSHLGNT